MPCSCHLVTKWCLTLCDPTNWSTPGFPVFHCLLEFVQLHVHWVSDDLLPSHPLLPPSPLASIILSMRVFSNDSTLHFRWPKYWNFSISPFNEYSGLISFRMDWFDLLAVQGTLKSLLQHHNSNALILQRSAFFMVQHSHLYITTRKKHIFDYMDLCWQNDATAF